MVTNDRPTFDQFRDEFLKAIGFEENLARAQSLYEFNLKAAQQGVSGSERFRGIADALKASSEQYLPQKPDLLFVSPFTQNDIQIRSKPFKSVIDKIYRRNILFNRSYPNPPRDGFIYGNEFYTQIDDLLRTRIICKYMDGPEFVTDNLCQYCCDKKIDHHVREISTEAGYYAWHFYFRTPVEISMGGQVQAVEMWTEIQFTTQLAEVIAGLTHEFYQQRRKGTASANAWKWRPASTEFQSAYIGHGLHLLEGIILKFRDEVLSAGDPSDEPSKATTANEAEAKKP